MKTILEYPIRVTNTQTIRIQPNAEVILVGLDAFGRPCIWAMVDPNEPVEEFTLHILGTGHTVPPDTHHLGSFTQDSNAWHVFSN